MPRTNREWKKRNVSAARYEICENGELIDKRTEPIAADAREGKDGKRNALLKLIAGLINVGAMETRLPLSWRYRYLQNRHGHPDAEVYYRYLPSNLVDRKKLKKFIPPSLAARHL